MPRQVLFIQGGGEGTHDEWDNQLVDRLGRELGPDYDIRYPRMPNETDPTYTRWKAALKKEFGSLEDGVSQSGLERLSVGEGAGEALVDRLLGGAHGQPGSPGDAGRQFERG